MAGFSGGPVVAAAAPPSAAAGQPQAVVALPPVPELMQALAHGRSARARWSAAESLRQHGTAAACAAPALIACLSDEDVDVRVSVVRALGYIGEAALPAIPALQGLLSDSDGGVRWAAADALGNFGHPAAPAVPKLVQALDDEEEDVRGSAASALGKFGQLGLDVAAAIPRMSLLVGVREEKEWHVRRAAAEALGRCGVAAAGAVPQLQGALLDEHPRVRAAVQAALEKISGSAEPAASSSEVLTSEAGACEHACARARRRRAIRRCRAFAA
eukprot:CAMPEP_0183554006 /NCGR_PEP_ID=MMETSP0371-20130417/76769_1 /TAXON_ID=268820 /ORGANISM="Peridinium aciculiferum, Strain PAER-2" /LENGTH=271 /DNA_ID=CAMNT_0025759705 /DNA_START=125 /DNA_END=938 /DNA_ORIENTATION=-